MQIVFSNQLLDDGEVELAQMIQKMYPAEYECSQRIVNHIKDKYENCKISQDEMTYLAVHIRRVSAELNKINEE